MSYQPDYIIEEEKEITDHCCGIYENGIASKYWHGKEKCKDFIKNSLSIVEL